MYAVIVVLLIMSFFLSLSIGLYFQGGEIASSVREYLEAIEYGYHEDIILRSKSYAKEDIILFLLIFLWPIGLLVLLLGLIKPKQDGKDSTVKSLLKIFK